MRVLAEIGARGVDGQRPVTLVRLVSQAEPKKKYFTFAVLKDMLNHLLENTFKKLYFLYFC